MNFRIALAQIDPVLGDLDANVRKHVEWAERARAAGAQLVVFPELSLTGYGVKDMNWELAVDPSKAPGSLAPLVAASKAITIIAGGIEEGPGFGIFNSAFLFEQGTVRTVHRKVYLPTYGMFEENRYFSPGTSVRAFDTPLGRLGVLVCEDLWHMSLPYLLALDGAQVVISLTASPTRMGGDKEGLTAAAVNTENHRVYARLLSVYVAFCNRVGFEDGVGFWGGSNLVAPGGETVATAKLFEEDLVVAQVDENEIRRSRRFSRHFLDEDFRLVQNELLRIHGDRSTPK
jgi:predicted amidohydrolase